MIKSSDRPRWLPRLVGGWGRMALARIGAAVTMAVSALAYRALSGYAEPSYVRPSALAISGAVALTGLAQLHPRLRASWRVAVAGVLVDAAAVIGLTWLYSFDPRSVVFILMLLAQAEAAVVQGFPGELLVWAGTTLGYGWAEVWAEMSRGVMANQGAITLRAMAGLVLTLGIGSLAGQLSGERVRRLAERQDELARIHGLVHGLDAIVWEADPATGKYLFVSHRAEEILGHPVERWLSQPDHWLKVVHREDRERAATARHVAVTTGSNHDFEYRAIAADGRLVWLRDLVHVETDPAGNPRRLRGLTLDITERKVAEQRLRAAEARYRALVEQIPAVTYIDAIDESSSTIYMSPQIESILGYPADEWLRDPKLWPKLLHPDDRERVLAANARTNRTGEGFREEYRLLTRDGRVVWLRDEATLMRDEIGRPEFWQGLMVDITERKQTEEQIEFLAYHDKLTGLPNRAMFENALELAVARARRHGHSVAVIYMDVDNFKQVNDSLGHAGGDELLREIASRLRAAVRETDVVARHGGDEFLVLLADLEAVSTGSEDPAPSELAEGLAVRIHRELGRPFVLSGGEFFVSASVGISLFPDDAGDERELMRYADAAMYGSKKGGPGRHLRFSRDMPEPPDRLSFANRLHKAVKRQQ
jgi:diguanylate cyclase (GGDEF)-like protein/PAS domain S-box-containing protein